MAKLYNYFQSKVLDDHSSELEALKLSFPDMPLDQEHLQMYSEIPLPQRQTAHAAAYDLAVPYHVTIAPGETKLVFFGFGLDFPKASDGSVIPENVIISPRSSLCKKKGLIMLYKFDKVSADKLTAAFYNISDSVVDIKPGERLAQLMILASDFNAEDFNTSDISLVSSVKEKLEFKEFMNPSTVSSFFFFQTPVDVTIPPKTVKYVMTGLKWKLPSNKVLILDSGDKLPSGLALGNGIGIVDADYYDNSDNEGEIGFVIYNTCSLPIKLSAGSVLGMGSVYTYLTHEDDIETSKERQGGFGSTDKES